MKASPHCHLESFLTASNLDVFVERALELKREYFVCTDHGYLYSSFKAYKKAKENKLKPILGLEFYFKDPTCDIISGTKADRCKYFSATIYCEDQEAYQALCKLISRTDFQTIEIREEKQNLLTWIDLELLSKYKTNIVLSGLHCIVGKAFLASEVDVGLKIFNKINSLFKNRLRVALICEPWEKKYAQVVEIKYNDRTKDSVMISDIVTTNAARNIKAINLVKKNGHYRIISKVTNGIYSEINKDIVSIKLHTGYLPLPCDIILKMNKFLKLLANRYKVPILASDYAYYAHKDDKLVQHVVLEGKDKIYANQHMKSEEEINQYLKDKMNLSQNEINEIFNNNNEWAKLFDNFKLEYQWRLADSKEDPLEKAFEIIKRNGRMKWDNKIYVDRLATEIKVIAKNGIKDLTPYFLPIVEVLDHYKQKKQLTSVGRGSAGGSLFCYLLGITNINPIVWDLPFSRFFSKTRIEMKKLPDIDTDLPQKETLIGKDGHSGFLYERWGNKAGHISTRQTVRLRSALKDVDRYLNGKVSEEIERFTASLPLPPQNVSDKDFVFGYEDEDTGTHVSGLIDVNEDLKKYIKKYPKNWSIVCKALGITRAFGKHACAHVLSDIPLDQIVPLKEGYITHYTHKEAEAAGLVKMDFLTVSQLLDIQVCLEFINKKNGDNFEPGYFTYNGVKTYIWDLPEDLDTHKSIWDGDTVSLFQINSKGMSVLSQKIKPTCLEDISSILALERPGPKDYIDPDTGLNMVQEYVLRRNNESEPDIKELVEILPKSYGTLIYQEDLGKVAKQLAGFNDEEAELVRENMAKKNMPKLAKIKPDFIAGATKKLPKETAEKIWEQMVTFGRYGFSIIHSYEYAMITYACMFLRHNYNLDWWSAVLTNADQKEITGVFWPYIKDLVAPPDINLSSDTMVPDYKTGKIRAKMGIIRGMGDKTIEPIVAGRPYKDIQDFVDRNISGPSLSHKLIHVGIMDSLFKPHMSLLEKLKTYEDAVEIKKFKEKKLEAEKNSKTMRSIQPKEGKIPEEYLNLSPIKDIAMKKQALPTLPIDLHSLGCKYSKILDPIFIKKYKVINPISGESTFLVDGEIIQGIDKDDFPKRNIYLASTCYVIDSKEFSYAKGTKRALKMVLDFGKGNIMEKVLWPNYKTGELKYPPGAKKGSICTIFMRKIEGKSGEMSITDIFVES